MGDKRHYEQIVDQSGIEIWVQYNSEIITDGEAGTEEEYEIEILAVDLIVGKSSVNILDRLTKKQQDSLKQLL